jgi:hypothetical protein
MPLYLSSSVYIFAILEISLPHPGVVGIYRGKTVWGRRVVYSEDPTSVCLDNGRLTV